MAVNPAQTADPPPKIKYAGLHRSYNLRSRKFGRHDLKEYYELSKDISIGNSEIDGVSVDCRFIFSKTRLGILQDKDHPGGIIYMNLTINQPSEWRLKEATVTVILKDKTPAPASRRLPSMASVEILEECYGPKALVGPIITAETTKDYTLEPSLEAFGFGGGLGGLGKSTTQPRTAWWNFNGTPKPADSSSSQYTTLHWTMSHNSLAYTSDAPPKIQTAFAFSHSYQPFLLQVKIDGKIRHLHRKCTMAIGAFKKPNSMCLLFEFDQNKKYEAHILDHARGLEDEMAKAACEEKAIEIQPRVSSANLTTQQTASDNQLPPSTTTRSAVDNNSTDDTGLPPPPDQSEIAAQLQAAHKTLMNINNPQIVPDITKTPIKVQKVADETSSVDDLSRDEIAEALQQMPTLAWWMIAILLRILRVLSISTPKQHSSASS
jgi:hypothetical protein